MSDGGSEEKKHDATETKLRKQRDDGSVASAQESAGFLSCAFGLIVLLASASMVWNLLQELIIVVIDQMTLPFDEAREASLTKLQNAIIRILLPIVGIVLIVGILTILIYNKGFLFAMKPVMPQFSRVSPTQGFKRVFGRRGMIETATSTVRVTLWLVIAGVLGLWALYELAAQLPCQGACAMKEIGPMFRLLAVLAIALMCLTAGADMIVQRRLFLHEQKMTETELKNERKNQSGAPELRQERRRRMQEANQPQRKPDPNNATMCFFFENRAVGIEFQPPDVPLPHVVAKANTLAESQALRKTVRANGWHNMESAKLTQAGMTTGLGDVIPEQMFTTFVSAVEEMFG